jgi:N6-L-threonylcarbamoyladenine synthase
MIRGGQTPADEDWYDFSFSGLKTAVATLVRTLEGMGTLERERRHVAASFQEAAVDVLVTKVMRAVDQTGCRRVLLGGGVSANRRLREETLARLGPAGRVLLASPRLSLDNGAMIARAGLFRFERGERAAPDASADASLPFPGLIRRS